LAWKRCRTARKLGLVRRQSEVRRAEDERLIALVAAAVEQRRRLGVGARHDDARHAHDVELVARGEQRLICSSSETSTLPPW
jgi:hypothetical protein